MPNPEINLAHQRTVRPELVEGFERANIATHPELVEGRRVNSGFERAY
jgi:hypothetical protein